PDVDPPDEVLSEDEPLLSDIDDPLRGRPGERYAPVRGDELTQPSNTALTRGLGPEGARDSGREFGGYLGRDAGRDFGRDSGRDFGRDPARDSGRDPARDFGRELGSEASRGPDRGRKLEQ